MARSTVKTKGCFEVAIGLTDAEAAAIGKLADSKGFKTTNTNDDYARAVAKIITDTQAQRSAIVEQLAKFDPEAAKEFAPVEAQPAAQDDDLDAMFDDIVAQESAKSEPKAPRAPRTTGQAAKSAVKNAASGIAGTIDALGALFSTKPGTLGSGPVFNADTYAAAKPLFAQAVADLKASGADIREVMQAVVRMVMAKFGGDAVAQMKPYIVQFTQDVRDGRIDIQQPVIENEAENDDTGAKESTNGPSINSEQGPQTLDGMATGEDSGAEGVGGIRGSDTGRGAGRKPNDSGANGPRVSGTRSGGSGSTSVRAPTPGEGRGRRGKSGTGSGLSEERSPVPVDLFSQPTEPVSVNNVQAVNFRITEDVRLGQGGEAEKFRDNLAAIRTLKAIEAEGRRATSEEQRTLARYVGWGGLANAFPNPESKEWKDEWKIRGAELQNLLTKKEYDLARRSTLDSHYTSHDIVSAMWAAAKRMGFKGGLAAETSMGVGNFLGLIPSELSGSTKFIGVEYDSLTARLAALLYPQSTILNSGIQDVPLADNAFDLNIGNPPFGDQSLRFQFKPEFNRVSIHNQFFLAGVDSLKPGGLQLNVVSRYLLDSTDKATRTMLAKKAKLVAAIRLPDTAFKENARTSVVTDIVILQRRDPADEADATQAFEWILNPIPPGNLLKEMDEAGRQRYNRLVNRYAKELAWVTTDQMPDPLGGEPMTVNSYFAQNPDMILGTLERSGKMQFKNDITVRPSEEALSASLAKAIAKLPEGIMSRSQEAVDASVERFKGMSDALRISLSGQEAGSIAFSPDGVMEQVYERETPEGDYELAKRALTEASPWSESLYQDEKGNWYTIEAKLDAEGKPEKVQKNGKATNLNVYDRKMFSSEADIPAGMLLGKEKLNRLTKLVKLRDLMVGQINLETEDAPSDAMEANRAALAGAYASFVAEEGFISKPANSSLVGNMPDGALVQALELSYRKAVSAAQARKMGEQPREEYAEPAPILSKRVIPKYEPPTRAESPADALSITLSESGRVDIDRMASLLGKTPEQITAEMFDNADKPLIFKDPETQAWVTRNDYLTGQVKKKLHAAQAANLPKHIAELEAIQPEPWGAENVTVLMGATFVPPQIYADFVQHVTGKPARVTFSQATNSFGVMADGTATREKHDEFGADGISIVSTVSALLNSTAIKVTESDGEGGSRINKELTDLAFLKAKQIANEFADWSFADSERRRTLVNLFNEKYNTRVNRQHDGQHLTLPGKVPDAIISMRRHQKNVIWRGISERFLLIDHVVGAGKSYSAIARAMERRRMGLSRKPAIIVPNHMVEQFTADVYRLYPGAKVLAAGKADFEKKKRRKVFAKIASGDWDIVIIPHSSFGKIGIAPETEMRYLEKELAIAEEAIKEAWEESDESEGSFRKPFNVKQAERLREKITTRMDTLRGRDNKDRLLTFEQMGIDDLTVDEAHEFKNLFYSSRLTGVKGMGNPSGSQKAFDLYSKVRVLRESPTGTVAFMTGTPISNSAVEMFNMMRYLAADELRELGLEHFDAWRSQFVSTDAGWEPNETGRLKEVNRLGRSWSNMRSLMDLYYSFTDSVGNDDIKKAYAEDNNGAQFPIPKVAGGDRKSVVVQPTKDQIELLEKTIDDFDSLPGITDPYERNIERLKLMDRARKVSLDVRAAVPGHKGDEKGGKLEKISDEVKRIYDKWTADRGTQLIFLDRSVPKTKGDDKIIKAYDALVAERLKALGANDEDGLRRASDKLEAFDADEIEQLRAAQNGGWNAYQQIKDNLVASGIPANEIRFIQEANNDAQKQALFDLVKSGEVRVLLGSTPRMGAGTNVQDRLIGLHHGDVTWKPSDIEQREGRIIRQGNKLLEKYGINNFEVEILAYATERTIDAKMWSLNSSKLKTINAIRNYDGSFSMDFEDADSVSMAELAALASGNPLLLERVKLDSEINGLELLRKQHQRKMWGYAGRLDDAEKALKNGKPEAARYNALYQESLAGYEELQADKAARSVTIEGKEYKTYGEAAQAVKASITEQQGGDEGAKFSVKIGERRLTSTNGALDAISDALGDDDAFLGTLDGEKYIGRSAFARHIAKKANDIGRGFESGDTKMLATGTLSGFTFEASISTSIYGNGYIVDIALVDAAGKTVSTTNSRPYDEGKFTASSLVNQVSDMASSAKPQYFASQAKRSLENAERAEKELPELREKANTPFPQAEELKQKQARLEVVITELSADKAAPSNADSAQAEEDGQEDGSDTRFSRATGQVAPVPRNSRGAVEGALPVSRVTAIADAIKSTWKNAPEIVVASSMEDEAIPATVRDYEQKQMSLGATGDTQGFVHGGKVYLIANQLSSPGHVVEVLFHESLGHIGLKGAFGKGMEQVLNQVILARNAEVRAKVKQYGLDVKSKSDMQHAAEEVLVVFCQEQSHLGFVKKAIAIIRTWLRENIPQLESMRLSDEEIIRNFVLPARRFIVDGPKRASAQSISMKSSGDSPLGNANLLANVVVTEAFRKEGLGGLDIPSQRVVLDSMVMVLQDLKIRAAVVELIPVNMMNNLVGGELSSKALLDDPSVLKHFSAINSDNSVPRTTDIASSLVRATAFVAAKQIPGVSQRGFTGDLDSTMAAFKRNLAASMSSETSVAAKGSTSLADMVRFAAEGYPAASAGKIDDRHIVTPTSDDLLGDVGADTPSSPPIVRNTVKNTNYYAANPDISMARTLGPEAFAMKIAPRPAGMPVADVQKAVAELSKTWKSGPTIKVVARTSDLPVRAPTDARGLIHKGTAYVVASNQLSRDDVARTLAHEAIGHYGLWKILGADGSRQFRNNLQLALKSGNKPLKAISEQVRETYVDDNGDFNLNPAQEADEIAAFAVEQALDADGNFNPGFGFLKQVWAKIADFLRELGIPIKFTNVELQGMLVASMRGLEAGQRLDGGSEVMVAAARGTKEAMTNNDVVGNTQGGLSADDSTPGATFDAQAAFEKHGGTGDIDESADITAKSNAFADMAEADGYKVAGRGDKYVTITKSFGKNSDGYDVEAIVKVRISDHSNVNRGHYFGDTDINIAPDDGYNRDTFEDALRKIKSAYVNDDLDTIIPNESTAPDSGGAFSRGTTDIRFSRASTLSATANKVVDKLNDHFNHEGTLNWWHKSLGSPYNLAQKSRPFKRVFTSAQDFLNDVSFYANEAADQASKLLPKLESWKDIGKSPISAEDNKAIEAPIFEGTLSWARDEAGKPVKIEDLEAKYADLDDEAKGQMLMKNRVVTEAQLKRWKASQLDIYSGAIRNRFEATFLRPGLVWKDAELKSIFNLTPEQSSLYHQFHAAVGTSLDNMAKAEMLRYGGKDVADMREMVLDAASADDAAVMLRDHLLELAEEDGGRSGILTDLANGMIDRADKVNKLKKEGYAPLSRFGQFSVDVVVDGKRQYFGLFESEGESNKMAAQMREEFGAENVETGTVAQAKFKQYKGITPESLELFGNMLGLDSTGDKESDKAFQEYLKLTKNNRSAMKRLIHRKGIAGYSTDTGRVLAAFIYSNARQTAAGLHMGEMADALEAIPKQEGQLSDYATKYADYVKNPQEEAQAIRGLMFAQYLGGNVASAFVNFTQPFTVSFPYLSQFGGVKGAAAALGKAMADQRKGEYEDDLAHALKVADEQGVTQPQSVHELQAQARGKATLRPGDGTRRGNAVAMASNALSKLSLGWGKLFGMAEQINRRTTFIAAFRIAVEKGIANPGAFATKAVDETQFINNKGNRAKYSRRVIGSTVMTFKSYSINYMELLHRMATQGGPEGKQAVALAMVMLFLMSGVGGLPFAGDAEDLIDGIAQRMGYNFSTKKAKQEFLEHWFGKAGAGFVDHGLTGIPGAPIDVAGRMGMGNLIPGTGIFMPKADHTKDWLEFVGVGADLVKRVAQGGGQLLDGRFVDAALSVSPKAVSNLVQGLRMGDKGYYQDAKGAKVIDTTPTEAAFKAIGFQPQSVALVGESNWINQSAKNLYSLKAQSIRAQWAKGIFEGDADAVNSAREAMREWNSKNPDQLISANMPSIIRKVREMRKTKSERILDTAPKAMRAQLQRDIAENNLQ